MSSCDNQGSHLLQGINVSCTPFSFDIHMGLLQWCSSLFLVRQADRNRLEANIEDKAA